MQDTSCHLTWSVEKRGVAASELSVLLLWSKCLGQGSDTFFPMGYGCAGRICAQIRNSIAKTLSKSSTTEACWQIAAHMGDDLFG